MPRSTVGELQYSDLRYLSDVALGFASACLCGTNGIMLF